MNSISTFLLISTLALTACDSKQEQARKADLENRADSLEDQAKATKKAAERDGETIEDSKKQIQRKAEAARIEGEFKAEALKKAAKQTREQK